MASRPVQPAGSVRWWDGYQWTGYVQPSQPQPMPPPTPGGPDGLYRLTISRVTSVVFVTFRRANTYTGTYDQLRKASRNVLIHNLLLGWWGIPFGLVWTPLSMARNAGAMKKLRRLAGQP